MNHPVLSVVLRVLCGIVSGSMLASFVWSLCTRQLHLGVWLTLLVGVLLSAATVCPPAWMLAVPFWLRLAAGIAATAVLLLFVSLYAYGWRETATYQEDALIVLGCRVVGTTPSKSLVRRLERAAAYHQRNPDAIIVVSGGQGSDEDCSEAQAMASYLTAHGVPASSILQEDRSTSTKENFAFSKALLDERFEHPYTIAFVSNDYHMFRSLRIARDTGFSNLGRISAATPCGTFFASGFRELCALAKTWIL